METSLTGPAFTRKGLELMYLQRQGAFHQPQQLRRGRYASCSRATYLDSAHSECTRNMARANEPTSMPSPGASMEHRSTQTLHADKRQYWPVMERSSFECAAAMHESCQEQEAYASCSWQSRCINMQLQTVCVAMSGAQDCNIRAAGAADCQVYMAGIQMLQPAAACRAGRLGLLPIAHADRRHVDDSRRLPLQPVSYSVAFSHILGKFPHLHCIVARAVNSPAAMLDRAADQ